jgi:hypothetical protein
LQYAIPYAIAFHIADPILQVMTKQSVQTLSSLTETNKHIFLAEFMTFARLFAIVISLPNINPPIPFLHYHLFFNGHLNDKPILSSL